MRIERLRMMPLIIPFRSTFKHASAERSRTASVWVEAEAADAKLLGYGEGCPREYVTGESVSSALAWFERHQASVVADINDIESLQTWVDNHNQSIDQGPAAWCAVELALLDLLGKMAACPLEALLSQPPLAESYRYSAVLGDGTEESFRRQAQKYLEAGFRDFKIKLSGVPERDLEKLACLNYAGLSLRIRADANNLWRSAAEVVDYIERLGNPFWAIEEPLRPRDFAGLVAVGGALGVRMILDESLTSLQDLQSLAGMPELWVLNLRVSKLGGMIRSLRLVERARTLGIPLIVGAHVGETSLLARAGLSLAAAAGDKLTAMEGAFGTHLIDHDICQRPLMFGAGGLLRPVEWELSAKPGSGLQTEGMR